MTIRTILTSVQSGLDPTPQLDAAVAVARKFGASVDVLYVKPNISAELAYTPDAMAFANVDYDALERFSEQRTEATRLSFEAWESKHPCARGVSFWVEQEGLLEEVIARRGRLADLLVLRHPDPAQPDTERTFDAGVFGSGRPCLIVRGKLPKELFGHAVVAWNGSLEGAHAVAGAMALLRAVSAVTVFNVPEPDGDKQHGVELAHALTRHGIAAHVAPTRDADGGVGAALLAVAAAADATLIVMGAYTHSRIRQRLLGGVTRHVLAHATAPLLMAH